MYTQLITPNPNIPCRPGYCLEYVRKAFDLPIRYGSATEAWNNSPSQHRDRNFPGLWVPVYFSIDIEPNGHIALLAPDGSVYSSSDNGNVPHHHTSIDELISYYAYWGKMQLTYLGWSEDVAGYPGVSTDSINFDSTPTATTPQEEDPLAPFTKDDLIAAAEQGAMNALNWAVDDGEGSKLSPFGLLGIIKPMVHATPHDTMEYKVPRGGANVSGETSLSGMVAYFDQSRIDTIAAMSAAEIANAVPQNLAQQVIDALGAKLTSK